jgi:hypothetical protein
LVVFVAVWLRGRLEVARPAGDLDAVRGWMKHFERVPASRTSTLENNGEYVRVRAHARPHNAWFFWPRSGTAIGHAKFTFIQ